MTSAEQERFERLLLHIIDITLETHMCFCRECQTRRRQGTFLSHAEQNYFQRGKPETAAGVGVMEQPAPKSPEGAVAIWDLVIQDMKERDEMGAKKYGTRLMSDNGRDPLIDAYQESLDKVVYLRQEIHKRLGR